MKQVLILTIIAFTNNFAIVFVSRFHTTVSQRFKFHAVNVVTSADRAEDDSFQSYLQDHCLQWKPLERGVFHSSVSLVRF
jgi:hypothetical protein